MQAALPDGASDVRKDQQPTQLYQGRQTQRNDVKTERIADARVYLTATSNFPFSYVRSINIQEERIGHGCLKGLAADW